MSGVRKSISLMVGVGIVIGVALGLVVSGTFAPGVSDSSGQSQTATQLHAQAWRRI